MQERIDWERLRRLRAAFLDGSAGRSDYWSDEGLLADYDATLGARIRWKWEFALGQLAELGWAAPDGVVVDWGSGTGIATRAFCASFRARSVRLVDRSALAVRFASTRLGAEHPELAVASGLDSSAPVGTLLVSHVLSELSSTARAELVSLVRCATATIWVESGTPTASATLVEIRERLRGELHPVAPCTHGEPCGLAAPGHERDWCHQFAPTPAEVFTSAHWARASRELGLDLRSLPVSFLVLDRRSPPRRPAGATRLVGRPRIRKGHALVTGCDASGVHERTVSKRRAPELFRACQRGELPSVGVWTCDDARVTAIEVTNAAQPRELR